MKANNTENKNESKQEVPNSNTGDTKDTKQAVSNSNSNNNETQKRRITPIELFIEEHGKEVKEKNPNISEAELRLKYFHTFQTLPITDKSEYVSRAQKINEERFASDPKPTNQNSPSTPVTKEASELNSFKNQVKNKGNLFASPFATNNPLSLNLHLNTDINNKANADTIKKDENSKEETKQNDSNLKPNNNEETSKRVTPLDLFIEEHGKEIRAKYQEFFGLPIQEAYTSEFKKLTAEEKTNYQLRAYKLNEERFGANTPSDSRIIHMSKPDATKGSDSGNKSETGNNVNKPTPSTGNGFGSGKAFGSGKGFGTGNGFGNGNRSITANGFGTKKVLGSNFMSKLRSGVDNKPTLNDGVDNKPTLNDGVGNKPALGGGLGNKPTIGGGPENKPTIGGGLGNKPAIGGFGNKPALGGGLGNRPALGYGFVKKPALVNGDTGAVNNFDTGYLYGNSPWAVDGLLRCKLNQQRTQSEKKLVSYIDLFIEERGEKIKEKYPDLSESDLHSKYIKEFQALPVQEKVKYVSRAAILNDKVYSHKSSKDSDDSDDYNDYNSNSESTLSDSTDDPPVDTDALALIPAYSPGTGTSANTSLGTESGSNTSFAGRGLGASTKISCGLGASTKIGGGLGASTKIGGGLGASTKIGRGLGASTKISGGLGASTKISGGLGASTKISGGLSASTKIGGGLSASTKIGGGLSASTKIGGGLSASTKIDGGLGASTKIGGGFGATTHIGTGTGSNTSLRTGIDAKISNKGVEMFIKVRQRHDDSLPRQQLIKLYGNLPQSIRRDYEEIAEMLNQKENEQPIEGKTSNVKTATKEDPKEEKIVKQQKKDKKHKKHKKESSSSSDDESSKDRKRKKHRITVINVYPTPNQFMYPYFNQQFFPQQARPPIRRFSSSSSTYSSSSSD